MTPTLTGETVTLTDGDYSRVLSCDDAEVLGRELLRLAGLARCAVEHRVRTERAATARAAFLAARPDAVEIIVDIWCHGMVHGLGAVVEDGRFLVRHTFREIAARVGVRKLLPE